MMRTVEERVSAVVVGVVEEEEEEGVGVGVVQQVIT